MKDYVIAIEERLVRHVLVKAESADEALQSTIDKYKCSQIVLDACDFAGVQVRCVSPEPTEWEEID